MVEDAPGSAPLLTSRHFRCTTLPPITRFHLFGSVGKEPDKVCDPFRMRFDACLEPDPSPVACETYAQSNV